ncbi:MAG: heavy-metal-associated domain-containing protein [Planctomycetes bacterium]|nr:heavy-metal-associated domain-containing protein [Planctomycetota bacterium]
MRHTRCTGLGLVTLAWATLALASVALAQNSPPAATTITVPTIHCMGCAKKMAGELYKVQGVAQVLANVEAHTVTVRAKSDAAPSPRALWEAVERAGYQPTRLEGPAGVATSKPKS